MGWSWGKKLFDWLFGSKIRAIRTAGMAALFGLYYLLADTLKGWFQELHGLLPDNLEVQLSQFLPAIRAANYWFPLRESFALYMSYRTWQLFLLCIRLVKWAVGM